MSTCDRKSRGDAGFTLVEVLVSLMLLSVVMVSVLPLIISTLRATSLTKVQTQAKNLGQERLEQVKDLRYHIDRQNGPFLDLLDLYYTNATVGAPATSIAASGGTLTGSYVPAGTGTNGEPVGPYFRVTTGPLPGADSYSQIIATQFLAPNGSVLAAAGFQNAYDSQAVGNDRPPTLSVAVTVITSWTQSGVSKTFRTYTRITDGRPQAPVIQSQSRATAVEISSTAADGKTLNLKGAVVNLDGSQSSGSSVSGQVSGALASRTGDPAVTGWLARLPVPITTTTTPQVAAQSGTGCSWYGFGLTDGTPGSGSALSSIGGGLPKAPANATDTTPSTSVITTGVKANGGGGACGMLSYDNLESGGIARSDAVGTAMVGAPFVKVPDTSGSNFVVTSTGYVTSTPLTTVPQTTRAGGSALMTQPVVLFPRSTASGSQAGLVTAQLVSSTLTCTSGSPTGTVLGRYTVVLRWWGDGPMDLLPRWHTATWVYDSGLGTPPVLTGDAWDPNNTDLGNGLRLSDVVQLGNAANSPNIVSTGATTGLRGFPNGVLTLSTASTLGNETLPGYSAIQVTLGQLTCVADDHR